MNEQPVLDRLECLLSRARTFRWRTEDELSLQTPRKRNVPDLTRLLVRQRVVVLQIASETLSLECRPQHKLVHCVGVLRPLRELVGVAWKLLLKCVDWLWVFVEKHLLSKLALSSKVTDNIDTTYRAVGISETLNASTGVLPRLLGHVSFEDIPHDIPELVMLLLEQYNETGRL